MAIFRAENSGETDHCIGDITAERDPQLAIVNAPQFNERFTQGSDAMHGRQGRDRSP